MPAVNLPNINISNDDFKSKQTMESILDTLMKYRKELNFLLMNLDEENMPTIVGRIEDGEGNISSISQTVSDITLAVSNNVDDIASLTITAQGIQSQVTSHASLIGSNTSSITQLADSISSKVSTTDFNGNTIASLINQTATTIALSASKIDLTGITTIYSPTSPATDYFSFYGNGVSLYASSLRRLDIYYDGAIVRFDGEPIRFNKGIYFNSVVNFSDANVTGLNIVFS